MRQDNTDVDYEDISNADLAIVPPPCAADVNADGTVTSDDVFAFLDGFFAGEADFNDDGRTNSDDYFAFLTAFFEGCA